jgi:hypothetical protein
MWRALIIILFVALGSAGAALAQTTETPARVSVVSLIANPGAYDGKRVLVEGYLTTIHFEDCALYLGKADFDRMIVQNAVRLKGQVCARKPTRTMTPWTLTRGRYASIEGTFRRGSDLEHGAYAGVLGEVTGAGPLLSRAEFMKQDTMPWWQTYLLHFVLGVIFVVMITVATGWIARAIQAAR